MGNPEPRPEAVSKPSRASLCQIAYLIGSRGNCRIPNPIPCTGAHHSPQSPHPRREYLGGRPSRLESDSYLAQDAPEHLSRPSSEADIDPFLINAMPNAVRVHTSPPIPSKTTITTRSTIRLLESGAGTLSAEFLGLAATGIGDEKAAVEVDEGRLELVLGVLIDVLGVVRDLPFRC